MPSSGYHPPNRSYDHFLRHTPRRFARAVTLALR